MSEQFYKAWVHLKTGTSIPVKVLASRTFSANSLTKDTLQAFEVLPTGNAKANLFVQGNNISHIFVTNEEIEP